MEAVFETFKPKSPRVSQFVDYYYLDIKPYNQSHQFKCFPHYNNTISIYSSHRFQEAPTVTFDETEDRFLIFTPIREKVLHVKQLGKVHRVVIVFHPLGIQQFFKNLNTDRIVTNFEFFEKEELDQLFSTADVNELTHLLDGFLEKRYTSFEHQVLQKSLAYIYDHFEEFSVTDLSEHLNISRQHLNRLFKSHLGVSAKKFQEIYLFRKTINKRLFDRSDESLTRLAYEFNFSDQSHFNKTYKNLTNNSPRAFFKKGTLLGTQDTFWHLQS